MVVGGIVVVVEGDVVVMTGADVVEPARVLVVAPGSVVAVVDDEPDSAGLHAATRSVRAATTRLIPNKLDQEVN